MKSPSPRRTAPATAYVRRPRRYSPNGAPLILPRQSALVLTLAVLAACDSAPEPAPPDVAGVYDSRWSDGRASAGLSVRLRPDSTGSAYGVESYCRLSVFDGGLGCGGACRLTTALRPTASGRVRFSLRSGPDHSSGLPNDTGEATASFALTVRPGRRDLGGTADFACTYHDGTAQRTVSYPATPLVLEFQPGVE